MKKEKEQRTLYGRLLGPLEVGKSALILTDRLIYRTSHVVGITRNDSRNACFETENRHYSVSPAPFPPAATNPLFERLAACA